MRLVMMKWLWVHNRVSNRFLHTIIFFLKWNSHSGIRHGLWCYKRLPSRLSIEVGASNTFIIYLLLFIILLFTFLFQVHRKRRENVRQGERPDCNHETEGISGGCDADPIGGSGYVNFFANKNVGSETNELVWTRSLESIVTSSQFFQRYPLL